MKIEAIYIAPVKSLALVSPARVHVGARGIVEDRRFFIISDRDRLVTQREIGALAQVRASYAIEPEVLRMEFPDGGVVEDAPADGDAVSARFFGARDVAGFVVGGGWGEALSKFAGVPLRLVRSAGNSFDALPISICSTASVEALRAASGASEIEVRRFRPNFYVSGCGAHEEDDWIGGTVALGGARVKVHMRDERCVMTTHNPDSGERDIDTLRMIAAYRTDQPKQVNFGVYGGVEQPGDVAVGDEVRPPVREEVQS